MKRTHIRNLYLIRLPMTDSQSSSKIFGHSQMTRRIRTIGCQSNIINIIGRNMKNLRSSCAHFDIRIQYHNSIMIGTQSDFILRTNHPFRRLTTDLAFLYFKRFSLRGIQYRSRHCDQYLLSGGTIGSPTHNIRYSDLPTFTFVLNNRSAFGCLSTEITSPIMIPSNPPAIFCFFSNPSTSRPTSVKIAPSSSGLSSNSR